MMKKTSSSVKKTPTNVRPKRHTKSGDRYSDLNNGKRLAEKFINDLAFDIDVRQWMYWNGRILEYNQAAAMDYGKVIAFDIWQEIGRMSKDDFNTFKSAAFYIQTAKGIANMIKMAESELALRTSELDSNPRLLNIQNGIIDLSNHHKIKLLDPDAKHKMTKLGPVIFDPNSKCPIFLKFLSRITDNNAELKRALQIVLGSTLEGESYEEALFILKGRGSNGKTTLMNVYHQLLGSYAKQLTPNFMMAKKTQEHPTEVADLFKVRFAVSLEPDEGCQLSESFIKWLTGRDVLKGRRMRQDFWHFNPTHKLFLCVNERPQITGVTHGTWRRIKEFPFDVTISDEEKDVMLQEKLRTELPGILNWTLEGFRLWKENGSRYYIPEIIKESTRSYMDSQDTVQPFIDEMCKLGPADSDEFITPTKDLYEPYESYCLDGSVSIKPLEFRKFKCVLESKGLRERKYTKEPFKGILVLSGIRLKTYADRNEQIKEQELDNLKQNTYAVN